MKRPLIIGYGNPLREDDGIGWRAAELVERDLKSDVADIMRCHQLTPELACEIEHASIVVFLDAAVDQEPGRVCTRRVAALRTAAWSHHLSPSQLLGLADNPPPAYWITCGVTSTEWREGLTEEGVAGAKRLAAKALSLLRECNPHADAAASDTTHRVPLR